MAATLRITFIAICCVGISSGAWAVAPDFLEKLTSESRPLEDRNRDGARRPYQVMQLLGVKEGMTVLDVGAGAGWYTRVLSAAVGPRGKVVSQFGPRALQNNNGQPARDLAASLGNVEPFFGNVSELPPNSVDAAVTMLNMHHGNAERNVPYLKEIFNVLRSGGMAAVSDHAGNPGVDNSSLHRMLASDVRTWLQEAGFTIVTESNILRQAADDRTRSMNDPILGRNTDRFLFIVRKP